jgi:hypothetical protein
VLRACKDLVDHGLARPVGKETDGRFQLLERYRHQVGASAAQEGYQVLATLARVDEQMPDPRDTIAGYPMPGRPPQFGDDPAVDAPSNPAGDLAAAAEPTVTASEEAIV